MCVYYTTISKPTGSIKVANVYTHYTNDFFFILSVAKTIESECDALYFPSNFSKVQFLKMYSLNFHLFQYTSVFVSSLDNYIQTF